MGNSGTYTHGFPDLRVIFKGAGGGGGGAECDADSWGRAGGPGGGLSIVFAKTIHRDGSISAGGTGPIGTKVNGGKHGGSGAGGSIRIEGYTVDLGDATVSVGTGRIAAFYEDSFTGTFSLGYLKNTGLDITDTIFADDFESGDLTEWSTSSVTDSGDLSADASADYWGDYGLKATIDDTTSIYALEDGSTTTEDPLDDETEYRARFYFDPNCATLTSGDVLNIFAGNTSSTSAFVVQMRDNSGTYQIRIGVYTDSVTFTAGTWYDITDGWNAIEIEWIASTHDGGDNGEMSLWIDGTAKETLSLVDNDTHTLTRVFLGAMGVDAGTSGSVYFDDFESRRMSYIGILPDPGIPDPEPAFNASWLKADYSYTGSQPHAVTSVEREQSVGDPVTDSYTYDNAGNMTCRVENSITWVHKYNVENRIEKVRQVNEGCSDDNEADDTQVWTFTYDGNGTRVKEVYENSTDTITKYFFAGGGYEIEDNGTTQTTKKYYHFAGMMVAMYDGTDVVYFANDHLSSASMVMDDSGDPISENRYMPFGEVRAIPGDDDPITQTDFGYTGQRDFLKVGDNPKMGLMDYRYRFLSTGLGRFISPDSIVPNLLNPQNLNRYAYAGNNPINFNDPTGHYYCPDEYDDNCLETADEILAFADLQYRYGGSGVQAYHNWLENYGVTITGDPIGDSAVRNILEAAVLAGDKIRDDLGTSFSGGHIFQETHGESEVTFDKDAKFYDEYGNELDGNCQTDLGIITCKSAMTVQNSLHEFGHIFSKYLQSQPDGLLAGAQLPYDAWANRTSVGYMCNTSPCMIHHFGYGDTAFTSVEEWADMYMNYILNGNPNYPKNGFTNATEGHGYKPYTRNQWMSYNFFNLLTSLVSP